MRRRQCINQIVAALLRQAHPTHWLIYPQVDVLRAKAPNTLIKLNDRDNVFHAVTSLHDVHPYAHVIAGANNSGRLSIWRA